MKFIKNFLYILIQCTWGFIQTLIGFVLFIKYAVKGCKREFYHGAIMTYHDGDWGGVSLGLFTFVSSKRDDSWLKDAIPHEYGHTIQSLLLGPFYNFIIGIPSFIWCNGKAGIEKRSKGTSYYDFYTESWANKCAEKVLKCDKIVYMDIQAAEIRKKLQEEITKNKPKVKS